ncbi:MAG: helix-turn-helix transcriptional regulator [Clostridiales bacterium]|nr:helix-turn-helix transcriptional regulator [Clostridiales bacterium]
MPSYGKVLYMKFVIKDLKNSINVSGIVNVHMFEFRGEYYTKDDSHPFYELVFVSSGSLNIKSDSFNGTLEKNQMIIHKPNETHSLSCRDRDYPKVIIIGFLCEGLVFSNFQPITLKNSDVKKLAEIIKEGRNVFAPPYDVPVFDMKKKKHPPFGAEQMLKLLLEYFLIGVFRSSKIEEQTFSKFSVEEILSYLNDNYKEKITIDELAFIFRTNRSTLCKEFKNYTSRTITNYVINKKLQSAKEKMLSTDKTLTEIAEEEGFESIHYFTRVFKKETGVSPNAYRKKNSICTD